MSLKSALDEWKFATHNLPWGVQSLCLSTLELAAQDKVNLVYGIDVKDGTPCLFNAISNLTTQGEQNPSSYAPYVVRWFDDVNRLLADIGVNTVPHRVSGIAAEILVHNFGQLKPATQEDYDRAELARESFMANCSPFIEPTDEELLTDWLLSIEDKTNAPTDGVRN